MSGPTATARPGAPAPLRGSPAGSVAAIRRLRASSITIGITLGVYLPFIAVTLREHGLSVPEVGLVMSLGAVAYVVAVPAWGHVADVILGRTRTLAVVGLVGGLLLLLILTGTPPLITALLYVAGSMCTAAWQPINDALVVNVVRDGPGYVRIRLLGSLFYALAATAAGVLYATTGFSAALGLVALGGAVLAIVAVRLPDVPRLDLAPDDAPSRAHRGSFLGVFGSSSLAFGIAPALLLILAAVALAFLGLNAANTFIGLRILQLGGGSVDVALAASVASIVEVPSMLAAGYLAPRLGLRALFVGSALIGAAGAAAWALAGSVDAILVSRTLAGVAFGGLFVAGVLTMRALLPDELQGTGQSLLQATCFGVAAVVANALGGLLYAQVGYSGVFAICAALGALSAIVAWPAYARAGPAVERARARPAPPRDAGHPTATIG
jgi:MFS family permease